MSRVEATTDHPSPDPAGSMPPASAPSTWSLWAWTVIACALLGASGVARGLMDRRHRDEVSFVERAPFPLKSIPSTLGGWRLMSGGDKTIDSRTMQITGGTDHILRTYVDDLTGVSLVVLVLFGPAEPVLPHTPEVCYPANGYSSAEDPSDRLIEADDKTAASFRTAVYSKPGGRTVLRQEVYHSFRLEGRWSPDVGAGRKFQRRNPGVFKVQVQRVVAAGERRDRDDPIDQFLRVLIPEIERLCGPTPAKGTAPSSR